MMKFLLSFRRTLDLQKSMDIPSVMMKLLYKLRHAGLTLYRCTIGAAFMMTDISTPRR